MLGIQFDGTYLTPELLQPSSEVYVIWCKSGENLSVLDVGEAIDVRARVSNHDRSDCWKRICSGPVVRKVDLSVNLPEKKVTIRILNPYLKLPPLFLF
jgi:hypothetical protein